MAAIIAGMLGSELHVTTGDAVSKPKQLARFLTEIEEGDCVFIDEIHQMRLRSEEMLGLGMEDFRITIPGNASGTVDPITTDIPKCVVIGATTRPAHLSRPLRDRFPLTVALEFYTVAELSEIIERRAARENIRITPDATRALARVSRETPRKALAIFDMAAAYADTIGANGIDLDTAKGALDVIGVDSLGLDERDRDYCHALASREGRRIGLAPLVGITGLNAREITDDIEPYLVRSGIVDMGARGRCLSVLAYGHLYPGLPIPLLRGMA
jgi:Holliday junction DNA helicase RuvB